MVPSPIYERQPLHGELEEHPLRCVVSSDTKALRWRCSTLTVPPGTCRKIDAGSAAAAIDCEIALEATAESEQSLLTRESTIRSAVSLGASCPRAQVSLHKQGDKSFRMREPAKACSAMKRATGTEGFRNARGFSCRFVSEGVMPRRHRLPIQAAIFARFFRSIRACCRRRQVMTRTIKNETSRLAITSLHRRDRVAPELWPDPRAARLMTQHANQ